MDSRADHLGGEPGRSQCRRQRLAVLDVVGKTRLSVSLSPASMSAEAVVCAAQISAVPSGPVPLTSPLPSPSLLLRLWLS